MGVFGRSTTTSRLCAQPPPGAPSESSSSSSCVGENRGQRRARGTGVSRGGRVRKTRTPKMAPTAVFAALKPRFRKFMASRFTVTVRARSCTSLAHAFAQTPGRSDLPGVDLRRKIKNLSFIGGLLLQDPSGLSHCVHRIVPWVRPLAVLKGRGLRSSHQTGVARSSATPRWRTNTRM